MSWRVHLSNRALYRLDILSGPRFPVLAAWPQPERVTYFDLSSGAALREHEHEIDDFAVREHEAWQTILPQLVAPNGAYPPVVASETWTVYTLRDGQRRFFYNADEAFIVNGPEAVKREGGPPLAVGLDRASGLLALLDTTGQLHLHPQSGESRHLDIGLTENPGGRSGIAVVDGERGVCAASDQTLVRVDSQGKLLKRVELPYSIGRFASSPDGRLLACGDMDANVIRIYDGDRLQPMFQRHAIDLMAGATQLQLIADLPPSRVAMNSLAVDNAGNLAFALAGVLCVTAVAQMRPLPKPQKLN